MSSPAPGIVPAQCNMLVACFDNDRNGNCGFSYLLESSSSVVCEGIQHELAAPSGTPLRL